MLSRWFLGSKTTGFNLSWHQSQCYALNLDAKKRQHYFYHLYVDYFQVEQVSYRDMTVSISRGCTDSCYHGCYAFGFGLTRVKCTSCCRSAGCNVGSVAATRYRLLDFKTLGGYLCLSVSSYLFKYFHKVL